VVIDMVAPGVRTIAEQTGLSVREGLH
jgi:hypothetical protein